MRSHDDGWFCDALVRIAPRLRQGRMVVAHLGNGASMCAICRGISGLLDGRLGAGRAAYGHAMQPDRPWGAALYAWPRADEDAQIRQVHCNGSDLLRISGGLSIKTRTLEQADNAKVHPAIDHLVFRVRREPGAMTAVMGGIDAIVFGGIGEDSRVVRRQVSARLGWLWIDHGRNAANAKVLSSEFSRSTVLIVASREEQVIATAVRDWR